MSNLSWRYVVYVALISRLCICSLMVVSDFFITDHNATGVSHFPSAQDASMTSTYQPFLKTFCKWDAAHFLHIARYGYSPTNPEKYAFFPLFPALVQLFAEFLLYVISIVEKAWCADTGVCSKESTTCAAADGSTARTCYLAEVTTYVENDIYIGSAVVISLCSYCCGCVILRQIGRLYATAESTANIAVEKKNPIENKPEEDKENELIAAYILHPATVFRYVSTPYQLRASSGSYGQLRTVAFRSLCLALSRRTNQSNHPSPHLHLPMLQTLNSVLPYSESIFAAFSWSGILFLSKPIKFVFAGSRKFSVLSVSCVWHDLISILQQYFLRVPAAVLVFAAASCTRSNAIMLSAYAIPPLLMVARGVLCLLDAGYSFCMRRDRDITFRQFLAYFFLVSIQCALEICTACAIFLSIVIPLILIDKHAEVCLEGHRLDASLPSLVCASERVSGSSSQRATDVLAYLIRFSLSHWQEIFSHIVLIVTHTVQSVLPSSMPPTHMLSVGTLMPTYTAIQRTYWNVGFLNQWFNYKRQLPNLLLGIPTLCIGYQTLMFLKQGSISSQGKTNTSESSPRYVLYLPAGLHLAGSMLLVYLWAHVQVSTRVLFSACPVMFVYIARHTHIAASLRAYLHSKSTNEAFESPEMWNKLVVWMLLFAILGILLHPNFYPWT